MERLGGIAVAVVIGLAVLGFKLARKDGTESEIRQQVISALSEFSDYGTHQGLYLDLLDEHHDRCFEDAYMFGGRRSAGSFQEDAYWNDLLTAMAAGAERQGYRDQAANLRALHEEMFGLPAEGEGGEG